MRLGYIVKYDGELSSTQKVYYDIDSAVNSALKFVSKLRAGEQLILYESSFNDSGFELVSQVLWANYFHVVDDLYALAGKRDSSPSGIVRGGKAYTFSQYRLILLTRDKEN